MRRFVCFLIIGGFLLLAGGCGKDKSTNPAKPPAGPANPQSGHLIIIQSMYEVIDDDSFCLYQGVYDLDKDSLVDKLGVNYYSEDMLFSNDGSIIYYTHRPKPSKTTALAWPSLDTIASYEGAGAGQLSLSSNNDYLMVSVGYPAIFRLPDLQPVFTDTIRSMTGAILPGRKEACYGYGYSLIKIDFSQEPVIKTEYPLKATSREQLGFRSLCPTPSGDSLIIFGRTPGWSGRVLLQIISTDSIEILDEFELPYNPYADRIIIDASGRKVFFYRSGNWIDMGPGTVFNGEVYCYDIYDREVTTIINENDYDFFYVAELRGSPQGESIFVGARGRLIEISTSTLETKECLNGRIEWSAMAVSPK